jgi:hypothetical protein
MRLWVTVFYGFISCSAAVAQISVREVATRAHLVEGKTSVSLALKNMGAQPLDAIILLEWLGKSGERHAFERRTLAIQPGESSIEFPMPLPPKSDPLFERLIYQINPGAKNYAAFLPQNGAVSLPNIADYAFTLGIISAGLPLPGKPYAVRIVTLHPITGQPVAGVEVASGEVKAVTGKDGSAVLYLIRKQEEDEDEWSDHVTARIGDFEQIGETTELRFPPSDLRIYTDKPLYQPGQMVHVRFLARGSDGKVIAGREHEIHIINPDADTEHSATVVTSRFGIASTDWKIPDMAKAGEYRIEVSRDDLDYPIRTSIEIRSYELPSFRVTVKPDRSWYSLRQKAVIEVRGDYLFGKPIRAGSVKIVEDDKEEPVAAGKFEAGEFRAAIDTAVDIGEGVRFIDRHFTAFLTDSSTNRTEPRKFDLRVSRDPLHVYIANVEYTATGQRLYVSVYEPDGSPATADVELLGEERVIMRARTNRFGIARLDAPQKESLRVRVGDTELNTNDVQSDKGVWLDTDKSLYRAGEPVRCHVDANVSKVAFLFAWNESGDNLFSRTIHLGNGGANVEIPYQVKFGRALNIGVVAAHSNTTRRVIFPGANELGLRASAASAMYRPGETATLNFHASSEAALGIAVVDQSVLERAATDQSFRRSFWRAESGRSFAGFTQSALMNLDPAKIDGDEQMVAAVVLENPVLIDSSSDFVEDQKNAFQYEAAKALEPLRRALDEAYLATLEWPKDDASLQAVLGGRLGNIADPWMKPFRAEFSISTAYDVLRFVSAGSDKQFGSADDFTAIEVRREWFGKFRALINERLRKLEDFPATEEEFVRLLSVGGINFHTLRDPWGNPLGVRIRHAGAQRIVAIVCDGPDRRTDTIDDFTVAQFTGPYFSAMRNRIEKAVNAAAQFPRSLEELQAALRTVAIDFSSLRDPWGRNYYATFGVRELFRDDIQLYSYSDYQGPVEQRTSRTPVKRTVLVLEIRSMGEDGVKNTYDDFSIATFTHEVKDAPETAASTAPSPPAVTIGGTGAITGTVTDQAGGVVPDVQVILDGQYETRSDAEGHYAFYGVKPGVYKLAFFSRGFQRHELGKVPVQANHVTGVDAVLQVGSVSEMVEVQAEPVQLQTMNASMAAAESSNETPRVREYFPETLYWQPELVTDSTGSAMLKLKLADTITTWHVAVIGSTVDGRIAETSAEVRAFQPFMADLDPPKVLTVGDEVVLPVPIRNYLDKRLTAVVTVTVPPQLSLGAVKQPGSIEPSASANATASLHANAPIPGARLRVTAVAKEASDAIGKPVAIHPYGQRRELTVNDLVSGSRAAHIAIPASAIAGSLRAEVKFYPSLLDRILETMESMLTRPYGCGEQTISSTYPNLLFLKAARGAQLKDPRLEARAMNHLSEGYQRLLRYQDESGGFTYWGRGEPDVALTSYALAFLRDAKEFLKIDEERVGNATSWLATQDASKSPGAQALQFGALVHTRDVEERLGAMARAAAKYDDPYAVAAFAVAAIDAGKLDTARPAIERLTRMARDEQGAAWWGEQVNSPFHGWGRFGQVESTALAVSALAQWKKAAGPDAAIEGLMQRGALFLLKNADTSGGWGTSQATVRSLMAMLDLWTGAAAHEAHSIDVLVNGTLAARVAIAEGNQTRGPVSLDITHRLHAGADNEISFAGERSAVTEVQTNATWYEPWREQPPAKDLRYEVHFSRTEVEVNTPVFCDVLVSRQRFRGFGMLIAEVGLPPGAEVDRGSLAAIVENRKNGVDSFDVAPDRIIFYVWPQAADSTFRFLFRPRFEMKAYTAPSVLYDYYNPDEKVSVSPIVIAVQPARLSP